MKHLLISVLTLYAAILQAQSPKKAVWMILDGIPADVLESVETPAIDEIASIGGYTHAWQGGKTGGYNETPTVSAPGYMNVLTGVWANKHNVRGNSNLSPNYNYWNIFRIAKHAKPEIRTAIFSSWQDNRTVLIGNGLPQSGPKMDFVFDGYELDTVQFPHSKTSEHIFDVDEFVSKNAAQLIEKEGPDLSWVYLWFTDDRGHKFGDSPEMREAVRKADGQVRRVWEAVKKRIDMGEDWIIVLTTDHGRDPETGQNHGGRSERERKAWIVTNESDLNTRFTNRIPQVVDILPSILHHMNIEIPNRIAQELDGIAFNKTCDFDELDLQLKNDQLFISWKPIGNSGSAGLWLTCSNEFAEGGLDKYIKIGKVDISSGFFETLLSRKMQKEFEDSQVMKLVMKSKNQTSNAWWVKNQLQND